MPPELVDRDSEHLRMLSLLHYAAAGVMALIGCFPLFHVAMGTFLTFFPAAMNTGPQQGAMPRAMGLMFMGIGLAFVLAGWSLAAAHFFTARFLQARRHFWFCVVVSGLTCFACLFTSGLVGIASLVTLLRPGVRDLFEAGCIREGVSASGVP